MKVEALPMLPPAEWEEAYDGTRLMHRCPTCAAKPLVVPPSHDEDLQSTLRTVAATLDGLARVCRTVALKAGR